MQAYLGRRVHRPATDGTVTETKTVPVTYSQDWHSTTLPQRQRSGILFRCWRVCAKRSSSHPKPSDALASRWPIWCIVKAFIERAATPLRSLETDFAIDSILDQPVRPLV